MRLGRFDDPDIDAQFRKQYVDELYQTLMRGVVRTDSKAHYTVVAFLGGFWLLPELEQLILPP